MKKCLSGVLILFQLLILIAIMGCFGGEEVWEDSSGKKYEGKDKEFIREVVRRVSSIFEIVDLQDVAVEEKLKRIKELEKFIEDNDGKFEFSWGTVFQRESSLSLIVNVGYTRIYQKTDECEIILKNFYEFQAVGKTDYLIIDGLLGEVYNSVKDEKVYKKEKEEDYKNLFEAMGQPKCITCDMKADPDWFPGAGCFKENEK